MHFKLKIHFIIFLLIIFGKNIEAQLLKIGFRIEPALLLTEKNNNSDFGLSPYSLYLTSIITPIENIGLEVRPGYFIGGEYYGGFEFGAFLRYSILGSKYYIVGGINNHINSMTGAHNGGSGISKAMLYKAIGIGYQKDSKLGFDLTYYWTNDKVFAYSNSYETGFITIKTFTKMNGIIKAAFVLSFDIL